MFQPVCPHARLDAVIREARAEAAIYRRAPINNTEEKQRFMAKGGRYTPSFDFKALDEDSYHHLIEQLNEARQYLDEIEGQHGGQIRDLYDDTLHEVAAYLDIARYVGEQPAIVQKSSQRIFGTPQNIEEAEELLQDATYHPDKNPEASPETMVDIYQQTLQTLGLGDQYTVKKTDESRITSVSETNKTLHVPENRRPENPSNQQYTANELDRLPVHEIGGHILRSENGFNQPFEILGTGSAGYNTIEEGITTALEELTNTASHTLFQKYAARVIATASARNNDDTFDDTFQRLEQHGIDQDKSWTTTMRAYWLYKDHIYLNGHQTIMEYLEGDGNLKDLYIGKTGGIERSEELREYSSVNEPIYSPTDAWPILADAW